jgi:hypothetical protein
MFAKKSANHATSIILGGETERMMTEKILKIQTCCCKISQWHLPMWLMLPFFLLYQCWFMCEKENWFGE